MAEAAAASLTAATPVGAKWPQVPARRKGRLLYRMAGEIVPDFWDPGLIDGILTDQGMTIVYGPSGCGKTAVVVDLACRVAAGRDWRGRKVKAGAVIYVASENPQSTERRVWAWCEHWKENKGIPLAVVETSIVLGEAGVKELAELVAQVKKDTGQEPRLVVLDTLARTMTGDENATKDMSEYVRWADELKAVTGAHLLIVHHTGKDESRGARGSSALRAATDHEIVLMKDSGSNHGSIRLTKVREGDLEGKVFGFELSPRNMGENMYGRPVSTVVALEAEPPAAKGGGGKETAELVAAYIRGNGGRATVEELRLELGALSTGKPESEGKAWRRLLADKRFRKLPGGYVGVVEERASEASEPAWGA